MRLISYAVILLSLIASAAWSTTYDEPWQDRVVQAADTFLRAKIVTNEKDKGVTVKVMKVLAGLPISGEITIGGYSMLDIHTYNRETDELAFQCEKGEEYYMFLEKGEAAKWKIATPTAGTALSMPGGYVAATYRHSAHMAMVREDVYESTMTAVFQKYHDLPYDTVKIRSFIDQWLSKPPKNFTDDLRGDDSQVFANQHVALELCFHLQVTPPLSVLEPFLTASGRHIQISAIRALSSNSSPEAKRRLLQYAENPGNNLFARIMALWGLRRCGAKELVPDLKTFLKTSPDEQASFDVYWMDPRVGTTFPQTLHEAISKVIEDLR